jgi:hypothetical protein
MAASASKVGYGLTATWNAAAIEEVISVNGLGPGQMEAAEATFMGSDNQYREHIAGLLSGPEVVIEVSALPKSTVQAATIADQQAGTKRSLVVTLPGSLGIWTYAGTLVGSYVQNGITPGERMTATITFRTSGKPVIS